MEHHFELRPEGYVDVELGLAAKHFDHRYFSGQLLGDHAFGSQDPQYSRVKANLFGQTEFLLNVVWVLQVLNDGNFLPFPVVQALLTGLAFASEPVLPLQPSPPGGCCVEVFLRERVNVRDEYLLTSLYRFDGPHHLKDWVFII